MVENIQGWLFGNAAEQTTALLAAQTAHNLHGDVLEIGVYHGKYFVVLANATQPGERAVAVDIFGSEQPEDTNAWGNKAIFLANVERYCSDRDVLAIEGNSKDELTQAMIAGGNYRFISVDGAHDTESVLNDLWLADRVLLSGGIVAMDDWDVWPGVREAERIYRQRDGGLMRIGMIPNKMLFTTNPEWAEIYTEVLRAFL